MTHISFGMCELSRARVRGRVKYRKGVVLLAGQGEPHKTNGSQGHIAELLLPSTADGDYKQN